MNFKIIIRLYLPNNIVTKKVGYKKDNKAICGRMGRGGRGWAEGKQQPCLARGEISTQTHRDHIPEVQNILNTNLTATLQKLEVQRH